MNKITDLQAKKLSEKNDKINDEIIDKILLILNGLSYRKSCYIAALLKHRIGDKSIVQKEQLVDKN